MTETQVSMERTSGRAALYVAAALSLFAALIHLWAMPEHMEEWWAYGAFFLAVALAQGFYAVGLLRWSGQLFYVAGVGGNLAIVVLYVLSRTSGVPFGPHAGEAEQAGLLDMAATAAEFGIVLALVSLLTGAYRRGVVNALLLVGAAIWALRLLGILS